MSGFKNKPDLLRKSINFLSQIYLIYFFLGLSLPKIKAIIFSDSNEYQNSRNQDSSQGDSDEEITLKDIPNLKKDSNSKMVFEEKNRDTTYLKYDKKLGSKTSVIALINNEIERKSNFSIIEENIRELVEEMKLKNLVLTIEPNMLVNNSYEIICEISDSKKIIKQDLDRKKIINQTIKSTPVMTMVLSGANFTIIPISERTQTLIIDGKTRWKWEITPKEKGFQELELDVYANLPNTLDAPYSLKVFKKLVLIKPSHLEAFFNFAKNNWDWIFALIAFTYWLYEANFFIALKNKIILIFFFFKKND